MTSLQFPSFLQPDLLLKALETRHNAKLEFTNVKSSDDHTANHLISAVDFVTVNVRNTATKEDQEIQLFVKYASPDEQRNHLYEEAFDNPKREVLFYNKIYPELLRFCENEPMVQEKIHLQNYPYCYYAADSKTIVLENVGIQGFKIHSPTIPQNEEHTLWVLKRMAEFHAVSFHYLRKTEYRIVKENPMMNWQCYSPKVKALFEKGLTDVYKAGIAVLNVPEHREKFELANNISNNLFDKCYPLSDTDSRFNVICLGDCWNNNIFFKYNESGNVADMKFVDFQLAHFGTMYYDLCLYIISSTDHNLWDTNITTFLHCYYDSFNETLKKFKDIETRSFSFEEFENDFYLRVPAVFVVVFQLFALRLLPRDEVANPAESNDGDLMEECVSYVRKVSTNEVTKVQFLNQVLAVYKVGERGYKALM